MSCGPIDEQWMSQWFIGELGSRSNRDVGFRVVRTQCAVLRPVTLNTLVKTMDKTFNNSMFGASIEKATALRYGAVQFTGEAIDSGRAFSIHINQRDGMYSRVMFHSDVPLGETGDVVQGRFSAHHNTKFIHIILLMLYFLRQSDEYVVYDIQELPTNKELQRAMHFTDVVNSLLCFGNE